MKPIEIPLKQGLKLKEFDNLGKAEEYFFSLINSSIAILSKMFVESYNTDLQYSFKFLSTFDSIINQCLSAKKYEHFGLKLEQFDRVLGVYFGELAVKNRYGKWIVREDGFVKNCYNLGIEEANGYCYHMGLTLTSSNFNLNNNKSVTLKVFTETFHIPKLFKSKFLKEELVNSINKFNDKRFSETDPTKTASNHEIDSFTNFNILPHLNDIELFLKEEKKPNSRDIVYHYLQYYCWKTQNRVVCQFLIDRLQFEESIAVRKHFFWSRLDMIKNLETYNISELIRVANDNTDTNSKSCQGLLKKNKINYR
jgi:hypothetical protein